jgi:molecular chaperone DnaK
VPQIEVTFDIDANGIVNVSAKDLGTGKSLIHTTLTSLDNYGDMISPLDVEEIRNDVETLRSSMASNDADEIRLAIDNLQQSAYRIADAMYADATEKKNRQG